MFDDTYKTIKASAEGIYKEKGSKFLAFAIPVTTETEIKGHVEKIKKEYYDAQEKYAKYSDANKNIVLQSVRIEQERLQNEQALAFQIFSQVAAQLQMSRAKLQEEKPAFAILEPASVPHLPTGTSKKIIILGLVFLAVAATSAWILFGKDLWQSLKEGVKEPTENKE